MIENIEELRTKLQRSGLSKSEVFGNREVDVFKARPVNPIAPQVAEVTHRSSKRVRIQIARRRRPVRKYERLTRNHVRTLTTIDPVSGDDVDWASALHGEDGVELPAC